MTKLNVQKRDVKESLANLRSQGLTVGVCYGPNFENVSVAFKDGDFRKLYKEAGTSSVITLTGDLEGKQCFIHDMQVHVTTGEILNVDFKIVAAGEKTEVTVPIEVTGEAPAVHDKKGILRTDHSEISVEAIPSNVPSEITIDISSLKEVGDSIKISDLTLPEGVEALEEENMTLVSISGLQEESEDDEESTGPTMEEVLADPSAGEESEEKEG